MSQHLFALFSLNFWNTYQQDSDSFVIQDVDLLHRLIKVLRCQIGDQYIIFDYQYHGQVTIHQITKKNIIVTVVWLKINSIRSKKITFLLPLLKKDALEQAVYSLTELGVDNIQLVITSKSRSSLMQPKEFVRLQTIVIVACEQSKNYQMTQLLTPVSLVDVLKSNASFDKRIVFDMNGASFFDIHQSSLSSKNIALLIGPEGGLQSDELQQVVQSGFQSCVLTDTTLRAVQAVAVSASLFRLI